MAERPIVIYGDPVLREVSEPVEEINQEIKDLVSDMMDTMKKAQGLGLAAVQVGEEGCLSFPGIYQKIVRPARLKMRAMDMDGNEFELDADGIVARAVLHEYDHLEGKLFIDHLSTISRSLLKGRLKKLATVS